MSIQIDLDEAIKTCGPGPVMALFKAQAVIRQRKEDEDKPKATLSIRNMTREQAQRLADELCVSVTWGDEWVEPKMSI